MSLMFQVSKLFPYPGKAIGVIADNADMFVMLAKFCFDYKLPAKVYMISAKTGRLVIDIDMTVAAHPDILPSLLEAYVLNGCGSVCACCGIGKETVLSTL